MSDRGAFWSPVPGWSGAGLVAPELCVAVAAPAAIWQVSGNTGGVLAPLGDVAVCGPRDTCAESRYALRLAPDSVLFVSEHAASTAFGWTADGAAVSDLGDGIVCIDVSGARAAELMALGSEYPFEASPGSRMESARLLFAGLRVAVLRRPGGWRLHIERPWAPALWHWLAAHAE